MNVISFGRVEIYFNMLLYQSRCENIISMRSGPNVGSMISYGDQIGVILAVYHAELRRSEVIKGGSKSPVPIQLRFCPNKHKNCFFMCTHRENVVLHAGRPGEDA